MRLFGLIEWRHLIYDRAQFAASGGGEDFLHLSMDAFVLPNEGTGKVHAVQAVVASPKRDRVELFTIAA